MHDKTFTFAVSNRRKCIANLRIQPMHFREDFCKYKTQKVMNAIVYHFYFNMMHFILIFIINI